MERGEERSTATFASGTMNRAATIPGVATIMFVFFLCGDTHLKVLPGEFHTPLCLGLPLVKNRPNNEKLAPLPADNGPLY